MRWLIGIAGAFVAGAACATQPLTLEFPANATQQAAVVESYGSYKVPVSGFSEDGLQTLWAEGEVSRQAWQIRADGLTTLQILAPLRDQLLAVGFETVFECEDADCGGFEFRYATDVLPEPEMHVDLGDFRFFAAQRMGQERPEYVSLLVSRTTGRGFVQVIRVGPETPGDPLTTTSTKGVMRAEPVKADPATKVGPQTGLPLLEQLETHGRAVLEDLRFQTGSSSLGDETFGSLQTLAGYLIDNPNRSIVLVGHTDAEGSLAGNIALSRKRAGSVLSRLTDGLGVPKVQVKADGVGFLSPLTTNLTEEGRELNRRVEVILSSTD